MMLWEARAIRVLCFKEGYGPMQSSAIGLEGKYEATHTVKDEIGLQPNRYPGSRKPLYVVVEESILSSEDPRMPAFIVNGIYEPKRGLSECYA